MSEKHVLARRTYWSKMTKEERSHRMREIALKKQKGMTFKQKRDHSMKMVAARVAKQSGKAVV